MKYFISPPFPSSRQLTDAEWHAEATCREIMHLQRSNAELTEFARESGANGDTEAAEDFATAARENEDVIVRKVESLRKAASEARAAGAPFRWAVFACKPTVCVDGFDPSAAAVDQGDGNDDGMVL